jgi:molecular chaperone GrpE (heat shock protein)
MEILNHWEMIVTFIVTLVGLLGFMVRHWFNNVNKDLEAARLSQAHLEGAVAALNHEYDSIKNDIRGHVDREEKLLWPKVDGLLEQFNAMTTRLVRIEANLPNGELRTLLTRFTAMEAMFQSTVIRLTDTIDEVEAEQKEHNHEAEDWKRRIVRLESARGTE